MNLQLGIPTRDNDFRRSEFMFLKMTISYCSNTILIMMVMGCDSQQIGLLFISKRGETGRLHVKVVCSVPVVPCTTVYLFASYPPPPLLE